MTRLPDQPAGDGRPGDPKPKAAGPDRSWRDRLKAAESWREGMRVGLPVILLALVAFAVTWHFIEPAPPRRVVIATGSKAGAYYGFALKYAQYFAENGIKLDVRETGGSVENYQLLSGPDSGVDLAIVQSGTAPDQRPSLEAVCGVYYEPVWLFYRDGGQELTRVSQLAGKRIAVGPAGSGVRPLALRLLDDNGISPDALGGTQLLDLGGDAAAKALRDGTADAAFFVISPGAPVVRTALETPGVRLMSFEQARAYARRHEYLSAVTLYAGSIDLRKNLPDRDVQLVAATATLVARDSTNKGIIGLLVQAAARTHAGGTLLSDPGVFPSGDRTELPLGKDAHYFLTTKPGWLHRTLPFWLASLVDRMLILVFPFLAVLLPLFRLTPPLYRWRMRSRIYRWYRQLRRIEHRPLDAPQSFGPAQAQEALRSLTSLEAEVMSVKVPLSYMEEFYNLRLHLAYIRVRLEAAPHDLAKAAREAVARMGAAPA